MGNGTADWEMMHSAYCSSPCTMSSWPSASPRAGCRCAAAWGHIGSILGEALSKTFHVYFAFGQKVLVFQKLLVFVFFSDEQIFVLEHHRKKSERNVEVLLLELLFGFVFL